MKQGRNEQCRCGSGRKAKHCCDSTSGPSPEAIDRSFVARAAEGSRPWLLAIRARDAVAIYLDELSVLPERFPELQVDLPALVDPALDRLLVACAVEDEHGIDDGLDEVGPGFDTPAERARLARVVVQLQEDGELHPSLAAFALFDLDRRDRCPALVEAAVIQAVSVRAGRARTPSGLLVAS